jgi:nicotinate phosphoribosyltransferase
MSGAWLDDGNAALFTDLYELTMAQAYVEHGMAEPATFSLFVRRMPKRRNYLLACGLSDVIRYLETVHFDQAALDVLATLGLFRAPFLKWLETFRFSGEVRAVLEGTPVFPGEPILEVTAPIAEAQIVETFVMNQIHLQTVLASKASRVVAAARGRAVVDFGARRMHGTDAAIKAAKAFYIAGVAATSNVLAGRVYGIPVAGTMAHSFIQSFDREEDAFRAFLRTYPTTTLLVDTYDTLRGVRMVCDLARRTPDGAQIRAIRLDSGDLARLSRAARRMLDEAGLRHVEIFASSGLDEDAIDELLRGDAPISGFGVGTKMGVSEDAPSLDIAYKLCAYAGIGRLKTSTGKPILPGAKQLFRGEHDRQATGDIIARRDEKAPGRPLLETVMRDGTRVVDAEPVERARERAAVELSLLPDRVRALEPADPPYRVEVSDALREDQERIIKRFSGDYPS